MSNKKDIKISDKLLSWVLGCECEFMDIKQSLDYKEELRIVYLETKKKTKYTSINLHTFIDNAKIKANLAGYKISQHWNKINVKYDCNYKSKRFDKYKHEVKDRFSIREIIDCLEWVAEKVGCEA